MHGTRRTAILLAFLCTAPATQVLAEPSADGERPPLYLAATPRMAVPVPAAEDESLTARRHVLRRRAARETVAGLAMVGVGVGMGVFAEGPDSVELTLVSIGGSAAIAGSFVMMHGSARLHVERALLRGVPLATLQRRERTAGRREFGLGAGLVIVGGALSWLSLLGNTPAVWASMYTLGGGAGTSGIFLMEHAVYRVHFGRRGESRMASFVPCVRALGAGAVAGVAATF